MLFLDCGLKFFENIVIDVSTNIIQLLRKCLPIVHLSLSSKMKGVEKFSGTFVTTFRPSNIPLIDKLPSSSRYVGGLFRLLFDFFNQVKYPETNKLGIRNFSLTFQKKLACGDSSNYEFLASSTSPKSLSS